MSESLKETRALMLGPGIYDSLTEEVKTRTGAKGIVLLVLGGTCGTGMSVKADLPTHLKLPAILRILADKLDSEIRDDLSKLHL